MLQSEFLPELQEIKWSGRETVIAFDSDISDKLRVAEAEDKLAQELSMRGCVVQRLRFPPGPNNQKMGLDDFLMAHGDEALEGLAAKTPTDPPAYERPIALNALMEANLPPMRWVWDEFILEGEVNLLYGDGGTGKSLLALHLGIDVALGRPFLSIETLRRPVLALFGEDSPSSVQDRARVCLSDRKLTGRPEVPFQLWCKPANETYLAIIDDTGVVQERPMLFALRTELERIGEPVLLILDSMADLFAMNESLRLPVNAAMKQVLGSLCRDFGATVLVLAHPSKASRSDGTHYSGSTAFNNAVRQRLTLRIEDTEPGLPIEGSPPRILEVAKSNSGAMQSIRLWYYGASIQSLPKDAPSSPMEAREAVRDTVLDLIDRGIRVVSMNGNVGDARSLRDLTATVRERHRMALGEREVKGHLRALEDIGVLKYRPSDKSQRPHTKAGYERGPECRQ